MIRIRYKTKKSVFEYRNVPKADALAKVQEHIALWSDCCSPSDTIAEWVDDADPDKTEAITI